jgi:hypothetical protein
LAGGLLIINLRFMKKYFLLFGIGFAFVNAASAMTYTWVPTDIDLEDLDHTKAYQWAIQWNVPAGQKIESAKITFYNIYDWTAEANDKLHVKVLDYDLAGNVPGGFQRKWNNNPTRTSFDAKPSRQVWWTTGDNQTPGNAFETVPGYYVGYWTDNNDKKVRTPVPEVSFTIPSAAFQYMNDGQWAMGLDPDCHYYNTGIKLDITTCSVPDGGSTGILLGLGALATQVFRFRFKK